MILSLCQWAQNTAFFTALRGSWYVYPVIMSAHLLGIAWFGGMILITDLRLLGWAMRKRPLSDVVDQLRVPKRVGLLMVAACGILMLGSKAEEYYYNIFFRIKLLLLACVFLHGMIFRRSVYDNPAALDGAAKMPGRAKLAGFLSLLLWAGIACAGRGIGYIEPPLDRIHAGLSAVPSAPIALAGPRLHNAHPGCCWAAALAGFDSCLPLQFQASQRRISERGANPARCMTAWPPRNTTKFGMD